jgi:hypothetical protein
MAIFLLVIARVLVSPVLDFILLLVKTRCFLRFLLSIFLLLGFCYSVLESSLLSTAVLFLILRR